MEEFEAKQLFQEISEYLLSLYDPERAEHSQRFFKTGKGEYGEGDIFLGIRVPVIRKAVKTYKDTPVDVVAMLLKSKYHEIRLFSLLLLVHRFSKAELVEQDEIYQLYLANTQFINNWDLVDSSAHKIVGKYLEHREREPLYALAQSKSLWDRRIAIIATAYFIGKNQYEDTLKISKILLHDTEDLIHKSVGWMLREVGKRDIEQEVTFLNAHYLSMPRTMLRYAIEKFSEEERKRYLKGFV